VTGTEELFIQLGELRRHELRRLIAISFAAHLVVVAMFGFSPESRISVPRGVVAVELVQAPAVARPAPPAPVAKPAPPKPAPPVPKKVVLPAEPTTPKVKPKPVKPVEKPAPTPAPAENLEDALAQLRDEIGEEAPPTEIAKAAPAAAGPLGSPDGVPISPEVAAWIKKTKIHVKNNWILQPGFRNEVLETHVEVDLDASGGVRGTPRISRRSGNPYYDESVVRAIQKSSPLPAPPEAGKWNFVFQPEDYY
jgi:colicin import membrane protein